jgi:hypothetical protein
MTLPSAGWYKISAVVKIQAGSSNGDIRCKFRNVTAGADVTDSEQGNSGIYSSLYGQIVLDTLLYVSAPTTLQLWAVNNSGASGTLIATNTSMKYQALQTAARYTIPVVSTIAPYYGVNISVTISGSGFTGATAVSFNGTAATSFVVVNDTTITATSPITFSSGPVSVMNPAGTGSSIASFYPAKPSSASIVNKTTLNLSSASGTFSTSESNALVLMAVLTRGYGGSLAPNATNGVSWNHLSGASGTVNTYINGNIDFYSAIFPTALINATLQFASYPSNGIQVQLYEIIGYNSSNPIDSYTVGTTNAVLTATSNAVLPIGFAVNYNADVTVQSGWSIGAPCGTKGFVNALNLATSSYGPLINNGTAITYTSGAADSRVFGIAAN